MRILVDDTHYIKGMAVYSDDLPDGKDIVFNTNKKTGTPVLGPKDNSVLKTVLSGLEKLWTGVKTIAKGIAKALGEIMGGLIEKIGNADFNGVFDLVNGGIFAAIGIGIAKYINGLSSVVKDGKGFLGGLSDIKDAVIDTFGAIQDSLKADTGNIERRYMATGKFRAYRTDQYLKSGDYAKIGGIYLAVGKHVAMVLTNGSKADYSATEDDVSNAIIDEDQPEVPDDTDWDNAYIVVNKINDWCNVCSDPDLDSDVIGKAYKGEVYKACDYDGTFFMIMYHGSEAFIHGSLVSISGQESISDEEGNRYVEVVYQDRKGNGGTVCVRKVPRTGKVVYIANTGEKLKIIGKADNGFYQVETPKGEGYITNNTVYTKAVLL